MTEPPPPPERAHTARDMILQALGAEPLSARELSQRAGLSEREVVSHLQFLQKSLKHGAQRLQLTPPRCLACGFIFHKRERLTRPGRCPICRSTHLCDPLFSLDQTK